MSPGIVRLRICGKDAGKTTSPEHRFSMRRSVVLGGEGAQSGALPVGPINVDISAELSIVEPETTRRVEMSKSPRSGVLLRRS